MRPWLRGQVDMKTGIAVLASAVALGSTFWGYASKAGASEQRLIALESRMERFENLLEERLPPIPPKPRK